MFISPRFRDIFGSGPIEVRRTDEPSAATRRESSGQSGDVAEAADPEAIWLDITAAHRRAARAFTPESLRAEELEGGDS